MPSIPITSADETLMLKAIGVRSIDDLFASIPPSIREQAKLKLELAEGWDIQSRGLSEHEIRTYFGQVAAKNACWPEYKHFLGGGIYDNIVPAIVNQLVLRGEFLTCYTPYQPEISQGTLQAIFEFQTMLARLTGMQVSNASMYDGATATAEAVLMAERLKGPSKNACYLVAESLSPDYKNVCDTFLKCHGNKRIDIPWSADGCVDLAKLKELIETHKPFAVVVGYPNYFGIVEPLDAIRSIVPLDTLLITSTSDPSVFSLYEAPGVLGVDIAVGEAHSLGTPMLFGGPHVGFFATLKKYLRQVPGRLCGETVDSNGKRAYTLTLSTREQHIRREKATSNICTNQGLIALRTVIYLSFLGKQGFEDLGVSHYSLMSYLTSQLELRGIQKLFAVGESYREAVFKIPNLNAALEKAKTNKIIPGIRMSTKFTADVFKDALLICVHTKHTKKDIDDLVKVLS